MNPEDVPLKLVDLAYKEATSESVTSAEVRGMLAPVLAAYEREIRARIIAGVRSYFESVDEDLYDDAEVLCGRIERGEY